MPACHLVQRSLLRLSGPDAAPFLQGQITQDIQGLAPGRPLYAGLLSPQGKALFDLFLFADGDDILLDVAADRADVLEKRLTMFRLRRQVTIAAEPTLAVFAAWPPALDRTHDPRLPDTTARFLAPAATPTDAALPEWHAHRLPLGLPESDEIGSDELLWLETNARELNGVSFTKGCYTGQENTARMHHRDRLRKRLLPFRAITANDAPIMAGDREAGQWRGHWHGTVRMALLRMDHADQPLTCAGEPLTLIRPSWLPMENQ